MWKYGPKCCPAETVGLLCELLTSGCKRLEKVKVTKALPMARGLTYPALTHYAGQIDMCP